MDDAEFDQIIARAANPNLIAGIYNYCDRCCPRCRFRDRCFNYLERRAEEAQEGDDPTAGVAGAVGHSLGRAMEMLQIISHRIGFDVSATDEEAEQAKAEHDRQVARTKADPLVELGSHYAKTAWPILRALRPVLVERGDVPVIEAADRIEELCVTVASKVYRAVSDTHDSDFDPDDLLSDANGSAKVARLFIDESRAAWRVLMQVGRATADGVPARLVALLDQLDAGIGARFPRAMDFVRPGFDTEAG